MEGEIVHLFKRYCKTPIRDHLEYANILFLFYQNFAPWLSLAFTVDN